MAEINYTKKALFGTVIIFVMTLVASFLAYLVRIILARKLPLEDFGLFYAVFTFIIFFSIFKDFGLRNALVKFIAQYNVKKNYSKIKTLVFSSLIFQLCFVIILMGLVLISSKFLTINYFKSEQAFILIIFSLFYLISSFLFMNARSCLKGFQNMKWVAMADSLKLVFTIIFIFIFLNLGFGIISPMFAYIVGEFIAFLILLFPLSKYRFIFKYKIKNFKSTTKQLFKFGMPVMFTGIGGKIISYVDVLLLTYFASLTVLAIYNVVLPTAMMFLIFGTSIATVVYPMVSELWAKKDKIRISSGLESIYSYLFILTIPLISLIFIFSDILLNIFFGKDFLIGVPVFRILLVGVLFFALSKVNFASISGLGKPAIVTKIIFLSAGINLVMNLILIPIYGMIGAAVATSVSYILAFFLSTFKLTKFIEIKVPWKNWGKAVFASIIFIIIVAVLKKVIMMHWIPELIIVSVIAGVIYLVLIFWLKTITVSELKIQLKRIFS